MKIGELNTLYRSKLHGIFMELLSHNTSKRKWTKRATIYFKLINNIEEPWGQQTSNSNKLLTSQTSL
jgi:hypothetical protein